MTSVCNDCSAEYLRVEDVECNQQEDDDPSTWGDALAAAVTAAGGLPSASSSSCFCYCSSRGGRRDGGRRSPPRNHNVLRVEGIVWLPLTGVGLPQATQVAVGTQVCWRLAPSRAAMMVSQISALLQRLLCQNKTIPTYSNNKELALTLSNLPGVNASLWWF